MPTDKSNHKPKFDIGIVSERFGLMQKWADDAFKFASDLDWLGDVHQYPEGSAKRELALLRDRVDLELTRCWGHLGAVRHVRAERSHCSDLVADELNRKKGNATDALRLMRRYHALFGDESEKDGTVIAETFPDGFVWDVYLRVSALTELVEQFPKHIRHSARQMHGWPMIVSHHLDSRRDFERVAELLELGADYPLSVGPRRRRGTETPMLRYLDPMIWRLDVLRSVLIENEKTRGHEDFAKRLFPIWWDYPDESPTAEVVAILKVVPTLPRLTEKTAREWSSLVIVPIILTKDAGTSASCKIPVLRNIWRHRSVKSLATFRSRLHSAVTDTLQRFARPA